MLLSFYFSGGEITKETSGHNFIYVYDQAIQPSGKSSITMRIRTPMDALVQLSTANTTGSNLYQIVIGKITLLVSLFF